jgi:hypothetical protein
MFWEASPPGGVAGVGKGQTGVFLCPLLSKPSFFSIPFLLCWVAKMKKEEK